MKVRTKLLVTCATGAIMLGTGSWAARAADMPLKAPVVVEEGWWWKSYFEIGGRGFVNDPQRGGLQSQGGQSLAKFYEYRDLTPGGFGNGWFATGSKNGLYQLDGWAKNVGYTDQAYELNWSKAGEHYLTVDWDQTPHVYSTSALTEYFGLGTNHLTLAPGVSAAQFGAAGCAAVPNAQPSGCVGLTSGSAAGNAVQNLINGNVHQTDLGIVRYTGSVEYRYTPTDDWDVRVNYGATHRVGSGVDGITFSPGTSGVRVDAARPIDDVTQNYGASGEYSGTSPWSQRYTFKMGYAGSTYTDRWDSYTIENPFCPAGGATNTATQGFCARNGSPSAPIALVSLPPSNDANGVNATLGADLPYKSRYMGTFSYTLMRQDDSFQALGSNPTVFTGPNGSNTTAAVTATPGVPFPSLKGQVNEILSNNVLTTQITPELKNKANYRYYDYDNGTPRWTLGQWVVADVMTASNSSSSFVPVSSLPISYVKQNAGDELVWRPWRTVNLGTAFGYERYDWNLEAVNATNEYSGKIFADWKATPDLMARASWLVAARRFDNYDYVNNMGAIQWPGTLLPPGASIATRTNTAMREFYLNNRDRNVAKVQVDWSATDRLTISPSAGLQYDDYQMDASSFGVGLNYSHQWRAGVEGTYLFAPGTSLLLSYMFERYHQYLVGSTATGTGNPIAPGSIYMTDIVDNVHTFTAAVNWAAIPDKLDVRFGYAVSVSTDTQPAIFGTGLGPSNGQYPAVTNVWQRFDASAKYKFDPDFVHNLGWKGNIYAKLLYAWERNRMGNWQIDIMNDYMLNVSSSTGYMTWMAFDNPNYDVQMVAGAIGFQW
jgi:MtrB/PioB family decaheme-associated outer membrane protein